jgi:hypothetical protein
MIMETSIRIIFGGEVYLIFVLYYESTEMYDIKILIPGELRMIVACGQCMLIA